MAKKKPLDAVHRLWGQVSEGGLGELVQRFKPASRADFLAELHRLGSAATLGTARGLRLAWTHVGVGWHDTVNAVANPSTLPEVVERHSRQRVNPIAPWVTSATAGTGSALVVAGDNAAWVETLGVAGVIGVVGAVAAVAWRPRVRRSDRRYRVTGTDALTARADVLAADMARATMDPEALAATDRLLLEIHGGARNLERLEAEGLRVGLLQDDRSVAHEPRNPAEQELSGELLQVRAELLHDVIDLQMLAQRHGARSRVEDRETYREVSDHLGAADPGDLS